MEYYLQSTTEENLYTCIIRQMWGSKTNNLTHWKPSDMIIVYVDRMLAALFEIISDPFVDETPVWSNELYPYRVSLRLIKVIHPEQRYSISKSDTRAVLQKHHTSGYGVGLVLAKRPLHPEAADILLKHIDALPDWQDFEPLKLLDALRTHEAREQSIVVEEVVQSTSNHIDKKEATIHTQMQYYLAKLGQSLGFEIWIPMADQGRSYNGTKLGELSRNALPKLPFSDDVIRIIQYIDVIWLKHQNPTHLFEVENTTSVYSGLLRMSDFSALIPSLNIEMYICASEQRYQKVKVEVNRPTFSYMPVPMVERCRFISYEQIGGFMEAQNEYLKHFNTSILHEVSEALYQ